MQEENQAAIALYLYSGSCDRGWWVLSVFTTNKHWSIIDCRGFFPNKHEYKNEDVVVGHCYATLITEGSSDTWYIDTCEDENEDGTYKKVHLMRIEAGSSLKWKHPPKCDLLNLHLGFILNCKIDWEWNVSNERSLTFLLRNHTQIASLVERLSFKDS